jgi:hypothetical protein
VTTLELKKEGGKKERSRSKQQQQLIRHRSEWQQNMHQTCHRLFILPTQMEEELSLSTKCKIKYKIGTFFKIQALIFL